MFWGGGALWPGWSGIPGPLGLMGLGDADSRSAMAQARPTIAVIVGDAASSFGQMVFAGARKAGEEFGINIAELGSQSESDVDAQNRILQEALAKTPMAIVLAPSS